MAMIYDASPCEELKIHLHVKTSAISWNMITVWCFSVMFGKAVCQALETYELRFLFTTFQMINWFFFMKSLSFLSLWVLVIGMLIVWKILWTVNLKIADCETYTRLWGLWSIFLFFVLLKQIIYWLSFFTDHSFVFVAICCDEKFLMLNLITSQKVDESVGLDSCDTNHVTYSYALLIDFDISIQLDFLSICYDASPL